MMWTVVIRTMMSEPQNSHYSAAPAPPSRSAPTTTSWAEPADIAATPTNPEDLRPILHCDRSSIEGVLATRPEPPSRMAAGERQCAARARPHQNRPAKLNSNLVSSLRHQSAISAGRCQSPGTGGGLQQISASRREIASGADILTAALPHHLLVINEGATIEQILLGDPLHYRRLPRVW
jgi:hypothetical protein